MFIANAGNERLAEVELRHEWGKGAWDLAAILPLFKCRFAAGLATAFASAAAAIATFTVGHGITYLYHDFPPMPDRAGALLRSELLFCYINSFSKNASFLQPTALRPREHSRLIDLIS